MSASIQAIVANIEVSIMTGQKPETETEFDVVVIGTGPGGEGAAMQLAKSGYNVAIVERHKALGGGCTHWGTIPSKALRHSVSRLIEYNNNPLFSGPGWQSGMTFSHILHYAESVIRKQVKLRSSFYDRNGVTVVHGTASFLDKNRIRVTKLDGSVDDLITQHVVIASGSRPYHPADIDFDHPRIYDSDKVLSLSHEPKTILIYGAGVVGSEYASIFRGMGVKVDLINQRDRLLSFLDAEISDALSYHLRNSGVVIRHNEEYESITGYDDKVVLKTKSGKTMAADCLLFANGRSGNIENLNCDVVGLEPNYRGQLEVDENYRTSVPNIYAVGDVIGWPSLASAAFDQGRSAAGNIVSNDGWRFVDDVPTGIYTIPEISSLGKTERELTDACVPYEIGQAFFKSIARAQISGEPVGLLKILFHRETLEVLGIHCFGDQAAEIVHIGQAIMNQKDGANTINYFVNTTFNYPTMAEAYRVAALDGLNRLF